MGIGFGKTAEQNLAILDRIDSFHRLDCRLAVGVSRKRFLGGDTLQEKDRRTALWTSYLVKHRIDIIRVHQINPSSQTQ
ncbi:MAG: dihydropteroate synthase [Thermoguttaceae bacterium]|nr:dihydropteroate synthase [Thermoguttaceae bacterium]